MDECKGCKRNPIIEEPTRYSPEEIAAALNKCIECRRAFRPEFADGHEDNYEADGELIMNNIKN